MIQLLKIISMVIVMTVLNTAQAELPLIPREVIFGNPDKALVKLSPDAKYITYLAPQDGVLNIWLAPADDISAAKVVTNDRERGIRSYYWAANSGYLLYMQDEKGDENFRLYSLEVESGKTTLLSPQKNVKTVIYAMSFLHPDEIIIGLNERNPSYFDCYRLNLLSGDQDLILENDEFKGFIFDENFNLRFAQKSNADGGSTYYLFKDKQWETYTEISFEDSDNTAIIGFKKNSDVFYMLDSRNRNTTALTEVNLSTGQSKIIADDAKADIDIMTVHPTEDIIQAVTVDYLKPIHKILDKRLEEDFAFLNDLEKGVLSITSRSKDDNNWLVAYYSDNFPIKYYKYNRPKRKAEFLFVNNAKLSQYKLADMKPVAIKARDGLELVSYLTLPNDAESAKTLPMVLIVHGGPWSRDVWGLNAQHQWLANRGYAVLSVNFRGSTGFGKDFLNAGNKQWGKKMHDDLIDAVNWAIAEKIADPKKVAIFGGSYGGYAALAGLTLTPDVFAAGVNIVGVANLLTFIKSVPLYWKPHLDNMRKRIGDWDNDDEKKMLAEVSPINHVHKIKKPLLIAHGKHDPRVNENESEQVVQAMQKNNIPVLYAYYDDEGHGFARPVNRLSFNALAEQFLSKVLGGRAEGINSALDGASLTLNGKKHPNAATAQHMLEQSMKN